MKNFLKRHRVAAGALWLASQCCLATASAGNWMFEPSYYSHSPVSPVTIGHVPPRGPIYARPQGAFVNGGYRQLRSTIRVGGQSYDHLNVFESWIQTGGQW